MANIADPRVEAAPHVHDATVLKTNLKCHHTRAADSLPGLCAEAIRGTSPLNDGSTKGLYSLNVDQMGAGVHIFHLDANGNANGMCWETVDFCNRLHLRNTRFEKGTYFALVTSNTIAQGSYAHQIRSRLLAMGATEVTPPHVSSGADVTAIVQNVTRWALETLHPAIPSAPEGMGLSQQLYFHRRPNCAYLTTQGNIPIALAGDRGAVYHGIALPDDGDGFDFPPEDAQEVAIKVVDIERALFFLNLGIPENPWQEIVLLILLQQENFVPRFFDAFQDGRYLYVVTEWASHGSLADLAGTHGGALPLNLVQELTKQFFQALIVMHGKYSLCHHDIKPGNLLYHNGRLLLTDWAQAFVMPQGGLIAPHPRHGTIGYMLPDAFNGHAYNGRWYDIWAFGGSMFSLIMGVPAMYRVPTAECILFEYIVVNRSVTRNPLNDQVQEILQHFQRNINGILQILQTPPANTRRNFAAELEELRQNLSLLGGFTQRLLVLPQDSLEMLEAIFYPADPTNPPSAHQFLQMAWMT